MHTLHVDLGREMRGGQHQVILLLKELRSAGHSFVLLANRASPLFEAARELRLNVEAADLIRLRRFANEFDLVHAHDAKAHTWAALASRRPLVVSRRVAFEIRRTALSRWKYSQAARYIAISRFVARVLVEAGVNPEIIDVVYDGVDLTPSLSWRADGAMVALASADSKKGRDLVELASKTARIPVTFSENLVRDLQGALAFVYISRSEGLGSAALLAMSRGIPVIASRIDGMAELFEDGVSGLYVDNDPAKIALAMQRLQSNAELAKTLGSNARKRVERCFNPSQLMLSTLATYRRALAA